MPQRPETPKLYFCFGLHWRPSDPQPAQTLPEGSTSLGTGGVGQSDSPSASRARGPRHPAWSPCAGISLGLRAPARRWGWQGPVAAPATLLCGSFSLSLPSSPDDSSHAGGLVPRASLLPWGRPWAPLLGNPWCNQSNQPPTRSPVSSASEPRPQEPGPTGPAQRQLPGPSPGAGVGICVSQPGRSNVHTGVQQRPHGGRPAPGHRAGVTPRTLWGPASSQGPWGAISPARGDFCVALGPPACGSRVHRPGLRHHLAGRADCSVLSDAPGAPCPEEAQCAQWHKQPRCICIKTGCKEQLALH